MQSYWRGLALVGGMAIGMFLSGAVLAEQPNIVVLVADDMGWEDNSVYGSTVATPNLEQLAGEGMVFETAMLTAPSCSPSRISLLSGLYPHQTGAEDMHIPLPKEHKILPHWLRQAGYFTGHMGKTHYGPHAEAQFDWYSSDLGDFTEFLAQVESSPFFMWVGFNDPHRPYGKQSKDSDPNLSEHNIGVDTADLSIRPHLADAPGTRAEMAAYFEEVRRIDGNVGWFLQQLRAASLLENTLVVYLSDNGAPFPREKTTLYDRGVRSPFIVRWPDKVAAGKRFMPMVSLIHFAPTILDVAGITVPDHMPGASLLPIFTGARSDGDLYAFSERNWHGQDAHIRAVRTEKYKLVLNSYIEQSQPYGCCLESSLWDLLDLKRAGELSPEQQLHFTAPRPRVELYDLSKDPEEYRNLAGQREYAEIAEQLAKVLQTWRNETGDFPYWKRRRADTSDRLTNVLFQPGVPPLIDP